MKHIHTFESFLNEANSVFKKGDGVRVTGDDGPDIKYGYEGVIVDGRIKKKGGKEYIKVQITGEGRPYMVDVETSMLHITSTTITTNPNAPKIDANKILADKRKELENEIKSKSRAIIGKTTKIGKIEVAENDLPMKLTQLRAKEIVPLLGKGWRLPTVAELEDMAAQHEKLGMAKNGPQYWSSEEKNNMNGYWVNMWYPNGPLDEPMMMIDYNIRAVKG